MSDYKESRYSRERAAEEKEANDHEDAEEAERKTRKENEKKDKGDCETEIADLALAINDELEARFSAGPMGRDELEALSERVANLFKKTKEYEAAPRIDLSGIPEYGRLERSRVTLDANIKEYVNSLNEPLSKKAADLETFLVGLKDKDKVVDDAKSLDKAKMACLKDILDTIEETKIFIAEKERVLSGDKFLKEEDSDLPQVKGAAKTLEEREKHFNGVIITELKSVLEKKAAEVKAKSSTKSEGTEREKDEATLNDLEDVCTFTADIKDSLKVIGIDCESKELKPDWDNIGKFRISKNAELQQILKNQLARIENEKNFSDEKGNEKDMPTVINELAPDIKWLRGHLAKMDGNPYFGVAHDVEKNKIKKYAETIEDKEIVENDLKKGLKAESEEIAAFFNKSDIPGKTADENEAFWNSLDTSGKVADYITSLDQFVDGKKRNANDFNSAFKKVWVEAYPSLQDDDSAWQVVKLDDCEEWGIITGYLQRIHDGQIIDDAVGRLYDDDFIKKRDELNLLRKTSDQNFMDLKELSRLKKMEDAGELDKAGYARLDVLSDNLSDFENKYLVLLNFKTNLGLEEMSKDISRLSSLEEAGTATLEEQDMLENLLVMRNVFDGLYIEAKSDLDELKKEKKANYLVKKEHKELTKLFDDLAESDESLNSAETSRIYFEELRNKLDDLKRDGKATPQELEELDEAEKKLTELKESKEVLLRERQDLLRLRDEKNTDCLENSLERLMDLDEEDKATPEDRAKLLELASLRDGIDAYGDNAPGASDAETMDKFRELDGLSAMKMNVRRERQLAKEIDPAISRVDILRGMRAAMIFTQADAVELDRMSRYPDILTPDEAIELEELKTKKETNVSIISNGMKADVMFTVEDSERLEELMRRQSAPENIEFEKLSRKRELFEKEIADIEKENKRMREHGPRMTTVPESELPAEIRKHYMRDRTIEAGKDSFASVLALGGTGLPFLFKKLKGFLGFAWEVMRTRKVPNSSKSKR